MVDDYIIDDFGMIQKELKPAPPKENDEDDTTQDKGAPK
jgi:hypothetical protein